MADSKTTAELRDSRSFRTRLESIIQEEAYANTTRQIDYSFSALTRESLRNLAGAVARMLPLAATDPGIVAEYSSGAASNMPDPVDNITDATLTAAVQAKWLAASEGL